MMKFTRTARCVAAGLALAALAGLAAGPQAVGSQKKRLPFRCVTREWEAAFDVKPPTYDSGTGKLSWVLEAKADTRLGTYEAFVMDSDGVETATLDVAFTPKQAECKAKARVTATVMLTHIDAENVCVVKIRPRQ